MVSRRREKRNRDRIALPSWNGIRRRKASGTTRCLLPLRGVREGKGQAAAVFLLRIVVGGEAIARPVVSEPTPAAEKRETRLPRCGMDVRSGSSSNRESGEAKGKMNEPRSKPVGLTKDAGYQVGARRTFPVACEEAWDFLTGEKGARIWLGVSSPFSFAKGSRYELDDGTTGIIRVYKPYSHMRLTWQPPGWSKASVIQLRVIEHGDEKTVVAFHQEHLPNGEEREKRKVYFQQVLDQLEAHWPRSR